VVRVLLLWIDEGMPPQKNVRKQIGLRSVLENRGKRVGRTKILKGVNSKKKKKGKGGGKFRKHERLFDVSNEEEKVESEQK